ncbi:MAG: hypothetical protein WA485_25175 [Candidatus Sulfotelmatobacter sp.]
MSDARDWRTLYAVAMLEGDSTQLPLRIDRAEEVILARMRELPQKFCLGSEQAELLSTLQNLRRLKSGPSNSDRQLRNIKI